MPDRPKGLDQATAAAVWASPSTREYQAPRGHGGVRRCAPCFSEPAWRRALPDTGSDRCSLHAWPYAARFGRIVRIVDVDAGIRRTNSTTLFGRTTTLSDAIADREITAKNCDLLPCQPATQVAEQASTRKDRCSKSEVKFVASFLGGRPRKSSRPALQDLLRTRYADSGVKLEDRCDLRVVGSQAGQGGREPSQG